MGDVIRLQEDECCPADIVLVYSSNSDRTCYVDSSKLTGETDLKHKEITDEVHDMYIRDLFFDQKVAIETDKNPNRVWFNIYGILSPLEDLTEKYRIEIEHIILRDQ